MKYNLNKIGQNFKIQLLEEVPPLEQNSWTIFLELLEQGLDNYFISKENIGIFIDQFAQSNQQQKISAINKLIEIISKNLTEVENSLEIETKIRVAKIIETNKAKLPPELHQIYEFLAYSLATGEPISAEDQEMIKKILSPEGLMELAELQTQRKISGLARNRFNRTISKESVARYLQESEKLNPDVLNPKVENKTVINSLRPLTVKRTQTPNPIPPFRAQPTPPVNNFYLNQNSTMGTMSQPSRPQSQAAIFSKPVKGIDQLLEKS